MKQILRKITKNRWVLRNIFQTIFFNFHYLPFSQAIRLPIWLYKPFFSKLKGSITICAPIKSGMIRMGYNNVGIYANNGIHFSNMGNITFHGSALIGNDCYIGVGEHADLTIGDNFRATTTFRMACFYKITFGDNVRFGWDCLVSDSDFHKMRKVSGGFTKGYAPIIIGNNNWIANGCRIMKRTKTPDFCTISSGTTLSGPVVVPPYSVIGVDKTIQVLKTGVWLDPQDEQIDYCFD